MRSLGKRWLFGVLVVLMGCAALMAAQEPAARGQGRGTGRGIQAPQYPVLALGAGLPSFSLLGVDGKRHSATEYAAAKVLAVVFESNHCPASIAYEQRIHDLYTKYRSRGVQLIAINPNNPKAVRLNELGYTDMTDSYDEMKLRAAFMRLPWPYLYDGETQQLSMTFGAVATPHIFIFDRDRKLQYQGAIDDNRAVALVKQPYAADAIDVLLAGRPVSINQTRAPGCTTKWLTTSVAGVEDEMKAIQAKPVTLTPIDHGGLTELRQNTASKKTLVVSFWSLGDRAAANQFGELQTTYRMYAGSNRPMDLVTISTESAARRDSVLEFLKSQYATTTNRQLTATEGDVRASFNAKWTATQPFTVVIGPDGKLLYEKDGRIDIYEVRRIILASFPDEPAWPGIHDYYQAALARMAAQRR